MKCNQEKCDNAASYRFTWPGQDEAPICTEHVNKLVNVAKATGLRLQIMPLGDESVSDA